ncbi:uncharacterized protein K460DRAFT_291120 [Cucurbitaria berberidis CBS 394.84]|uniref:Uncharacterized protein n=1 Tax=Cucurbitaria berberidis CBS 394.84 TaxID=1168544 RepID=A0A9P4GCQ5_9PLEO|nr:uncharacterized protein K460DRAFT_291120 [Cucurbitaria berberidis CBS 394.84]KAF1842936.1 hypothetical protein K460DRAFT_291120 [Cucurbitaria berberidis CBS 394.84]
MSSPNGPLYEVLQNPVTPQAQAEIVSYLWRDGVTAPSRSVHFDWTAYFAYYTKQCKAALVNEGLYLSARTHHDILTIARLLEDESTEEMIKQKLRQNLTQQRPQAEEDRMLDGSVKLATRLLAMVNIGPLASEISGRYFMNWDQGSLRDAVHRHFNILPEIDPDPKYSVIGTDLTCRNIDRISGIEVVPTDNLIDHLRLVERDTKVCVFHHVSFLKRMNATQNSSLYPDGLIEETLDTIALLFPDTDRKTRRWLESDFQTHPLLSKLDQGLLSCGHFRAGHPSRRFERFRFWRDRLCTLREAVDDATPPSKALLKALRDSKNGDRWFNSWVAIVAIGLTLFFGLVQSIEGAVQVYKAYHPAPA